VVLPSRRPARQVALRLRVPATHELKSVLVNDRHSAQIDLASATIGLNDLTGKVRVVAKFAPK
jgi:hypothetical protein